MLDLVEAEVEVLEEREGVEAFEVRYQIVVEVEVFEGEGEAVGEVDGGDMVLAEA
jgi:hypothetical protein